MTLPYIIHNSLLNTKRLKHCYN